MLERLRKLWASNKNGSEGSKASAEEPIHAELDTGLDTEEAEAPPSDQFLDDQPITDRLSDRFNRAPFASRLAHTLAQRADPSSIVVGLYGPWGDGKTSVLEMMGEALKEYPRVILVRFNPWHFQSQDALLRGFFATLAEAMEKSLPNKKEMVGDLLKQYGGLLSLANVTLGGVVQISAGEAAKSVGESLSTVSLEELRLRIDRMLGQSKRRLVVLVDDIDRLDREETHAIFKLVKLSASFKHTSYVLAFDDDVVAAALGERYGEGGAKGGRAFLEKIVQVPLNLPPADTNSLRLIALEGVQRAVDQTGIVLTQSQVDAFIRHFDDVIAPALGTPRKAKLLSNALLFALPILKGEVNTVDLMLIEGVRVIYPGLYAAIRSNRDLFLKGGRAGARDDHQKREEDISALLEKSLPHMSVEERGWTRRRLLEPLFPRLGNSMYGGEWDSTWAAEQKICAGEYFQRYFAYGVPLGDVSDRLIVEFIKAAPDLSASDSRAALQRFSEMQGMPRLVMRLRQRKETIGASEAKAIALTFARNGDLLPRERGMLTLVDTRASAAILISDMLKQLQMGPERQSAAEQVIREASSVGFASECLRWIHHNNDRPEERRVLSDDGDKALSRLASKRIEVASAEAPFFLTEPKDAPTLYWLWRQETSDAHVQQALRAQLKTSADHVDAFLACFVGESWGVESGIPRPGDFDRRQYDSVSKLVGADYIAAKLKEQYGAELDSPEEYPAEGMDQPRRVSHQFMNVHIFVTQEKGSSSGSDSAHASEESMK
ncbi:KAP family P-loop NTPase fold protein [Stenotrophomonas tumulicola]|uniref:KAP family NTPase n=1 Tax=Stenotrophomonas tumulicola TaxID=1685415 RepID=A0A7W3FIR2_9GAMM|nr:KAP family NTPase [Stenotrophomonas tumulicola]MBA8680245.1 KAP family NTPase [Stenotrophomonas tumulicola]